MPITFDCPCGKQLRVRDELGGKNVRCPACGGVVAVPAAEPRFEVVDEPAAPPRPAARPAAKPAFEVVDDPPARRAIPGWKKAAADEDDGDDRPLEMQAAADRPRVKRRWDEDDRPRKRTKPKAEGGHFALEKGIVNSGVLGGLLAMGVAVAWFVIGLANGWLFYYPPILFVVGLVAFFKGLAGGNE